MQIRSIVTSLVLAMVLLLASCGGSGSNNPPLSTGGGGASLALTTVVTGLSNPTGFVPANDGSGRWFILEQRGTIRAIQSNALLATPFLDISANVTSGGQTGLLGLALHPSFSQNRKFYVNYTRTQGTQLQSVISEFLVSATDPSRADSSSERVLLTLNQPYDNHNGGQLAFGPDGYLYIAFGDGGGAGDPLHNGQNTNVLFGKILRIDVNSTSGGNAYGIPLDNPFVNGSGAPEVWAYGLRNPWRFSFDQSGRLFAGDVGQDNYEEIDIITRGANYGWNVMEGAHCFSPSSGCNQTGLTLPIAEYNHTEGEGVIGGFVYSGASIPSLQGAYVFGDLQSGKIWTLRESPPGTWTRTLVITGGPAISSFGQDNSGEVYVLDYAGGAVMKITAK